MAAHSGAPFVPVVTPAQSIIPNLQINQMPGQIHPVQQTGGVQFDPMGFVVKPDDKEEESAEVKLEKKRKQDAERKKKEEEERAKQQAAKQQDKSRPISSTPIAGTPWCVVWTGDGRVFFYNPSTRTSVWERPEDLLGRADVDKAIAAAPDQAGSNSAVTATKEDKPNSIVDTATDKAANAKRSESESSGENDDLPNKKLKANDTTGKSPLTHIR